MGLDVTVHDVLSTCLALQDADRAVNWRLGPPTGAKEIRLDYGPVASQDRFTMFVSHSPGEDEIPSVVCSHGVATKFLQEDRNGAVGSARRHEFVRRVGCHGS